MALFQAIWLAIGFPLLAVYGVFEWTKLAIGVILSGEIFKRPSEEEARKLRDARDSFWNLSKEWKGLSHQFITLSDGTKTHYVTNATPDDAKPNKPLVVFLHGFPDSWVVWRHLITNPSIQEKCIFAAVDMPGYGGSDSLKSYDASNLLGHVAELVVALRERYDLHGGSTGKRKAILVAHDCGATIAFRLAAEVPALADRFIISNGPLISCAQHNALERICHAVMSLMKLRFCEATQALEPLYRQLRMSYYVIVFHFPVFMLRVLGCIGNHAFVRRIQTVSFGMSPEVMEDEIAILLAGSLGPSTENCSTSTKDGEGYPLSAVKRSKTSSFIDPVRYYREGAALDPWRKSPELLKRIQHFGQWTDSANDSSEKAQKQPAGSLGAKTTVFWGENDRCLHKELALGGLEKYLVPDSQVISLPRTSHGTPVQKESRAAFAKTLEWAIDGEEGDIQEAVLSVYFDAIVTLRQ